MVVVCIMFLTAVILDLHASVYSITSVYSMRISLQPTHQSTAYASIYGTGISLEHTHQSAAYAVIFGSAGGNTRPEGCD